MLGLGRFFDSGVFGFGEKGGEGEVVESDKLNEKVRCKEMIRI